MPLTIPSSITSPLKEELEAVFEYKIADYISKVLLHDSINYKQRCKNLIQFILYLTENSLALHEFLEVNVGGYIGDLDLISTRKSDFSLIIPYVSELAIRNYAAIFEVSEVESKSVCQEKIRDALLNAKFIFTDDCINVCNWWSISVYNEVCRLINKSCDTTSIDFDLEHILLDAKSYFGYMLAYFLKDALLALEIEDKYFSKVAAVADHSPTSLKHCSKGSGEACLLDDDRERVVEDLRSTTVAECNFLGYASSLVNYSRGDGFSSSFMLCDDTAADSSCLALFKEEEQEEEKKDSKDEISEDTKLVLSTL